MPSEKLVSIIIPTYKQWNVLPRAVDSALNQTYKHIEVIVVDDNDPYTEFRKNTEEIMKKYENDSRVVYVKHSKNMERCAARNTGIKNSNGTYIMFLDNDDEFYKTKVEAQVKNLESLGADWGMNYTKYVRKNGDKIVAVCAENRSGNLLVEALKRNLFIHAGSNLMVRKSIIDEVGGFNESISINEDIEFITRVMKKYKLAYVDNLGLIVNVHERDSLDFEDITKKYLNSISGTLQLLSETELEDVHRMINLQRFRFKLQSQRDLRSALKLISSNKINTHIAIKYLGHLFWRRLTKKSYGFKY